MTSASQPREAAPILELNTTPLIDVMLVLLIMFIVTIPLQTHAVKLNLPTACGDCPVVHSTKNELVVTRSDALLWNGQPISSEALRFNLIESQRMTPKPELHFRPDPDARYEVVDEVLATTKRVGVTNMGFVGNERFADF